MAVAERAAERLLVDVAHVRQGLADAMQQLGQPPDPGAGADPRLQPAGIVRAQALEAVERHDGAVALDQRREGMAGADDADRPGPLRMIALSSSRFSGVANCCGVAVT